MITIIALIFMNLGQRNPGDLSAYSVFNPNQERILGTMSANDFGLGNIHLYDEILEII